MENKYYKKIKLNTCIMLKYIYLLKIYYRYSICIIYLMCRYLACTMCNRILLHARTPVMIKQQQARTPGMSTQASASIRHENTASANTSRDHTVSASTNNDHTTSTPLLLSPPPPVLTLTRSVPRPRHRRPPHHPLS